MSINPYESPKEPSEPPIKVRVSLSSILCSFSFCAALLRGSLVWLVCAVMAIVYGARTGLDLTGIVWLLHVSVLCPLIVASGFAYYSWRQRVLHPLRELSVLIANNPTIAEHYVNRGTLYLDETLHADRAADDFDKAIELEPGKWRVHLLRGVAHALCKRYTQAIPDFTQAIVLAIESDELTRDEWYLYGWRSSAHFHVGDFEHAAADATEAIGLLSEGERRTKKQPLISLYYRRAMSHSRLGQQDAARRDFSQAHRLDRLWLQDPRPGRRYVFLAIYGALCIAVICGVRVPFGR